jgi:hypothetical protein
MKLRAVVVVIALAPSIAGAETPAVGREIDLGLRGLGFMQVGQWDPLALGFQAGGGVRFRSVTVLGQLEYTALWPASYRHGTIAVSDNQGLEGSMLRIALVARYAFARTHSAPNERSGERLETSWYVDAGLGEQRVSIDRELEFSRPDLELGIGGMLGVGRRDSPSYWGTYYQLHAFWAPAAMTPVPSADCGGPCSGFPGAGGDDIGLSFDLGFAFGT